MKCKVCGNDVPNGAKFCENCGSKMPEVAPQEQEVVTNNSNNQINAEPVANEDTTEKVQFCQNCGEKLDIKAKICSKCGARVEGSTQEQTQQIVNNSVQFCQNCGEKLDIKAKICSKCGARVDNETSMDAQENSNVDSFDGEISSLYVLGIGVIATIIMTLLLGAIGFLIVCFASGFLISGTKRDAGIAGIINAIIYFFVFLFAQYSVLGLGVAVLVMFIGVIVSIIGKYAENHYHN